MKRLLTLLAIGCALALVAFPGAVFMAYASEPPSTLPATISNAYVAIVAAQEHGVRAAKVTVWVSELNNLLATLQGGNLSGQSSTAVERTASNIYTNASAAAARAGRLHIIDIAVEFIAVVPLSLTLAYLTLKTVDWKEERERERKMARIVRVSEREEA